eukprot:CAMPEP_0206001464 /NCGR_PEP_ID=MMETSP1464-20131121/2131_1 /ASSEMBLY_ACC=CAM_ASM_001124 /TAXON_ID=119497 /ORGANISM="Exanthemachrysis gayraliae, Strain RCC1523" /LENGTH=72 /DNA_ID=CAMNT_0053374779 /DNA_START=151 /DNA_END=370 /DNA_ORIENTATION=+
MKLTVAACQRGVFDGLALFTVVVNLKSAAFMDVIGTNGHTVVKVLALVDDEALFDWHACHGCHFLAETGDVL